VYLCNVTLFTIPKKLSGDNWVIGQPFRLFRRTPLTAQMRTAILTSENVEIKFMTPLTIAQIVVSILLALSILLQQRGSGIDASLGGGGESFHTRRGFEKFLVQGSIVLSILFLLIALAQAYVG
jgi:protein translocase SecG subunit